MLTGVFVFNSWRRSRWDLNWQDTEGSDGLRETDSRKEWQCEQGYVGSGLS